MNIHHNNMKKMTKIVNFSTCDVLSILIQLIVNYFNPSSTSPHLITKFLTVVIYHLLRSKVGDILHAKWNKI